MFAKGKATQEHELVHQRRKAKDCMDLKNPKVEKRAVVYATLGLRDRNSITCPSSHG